MTVQQLIEALQQMPPHHFVVVVQRSIADGKPAIDFATEVESVEPAGQGVVLVEAA